MKKIITLVITCLLLIGGYIAAENISFESQEQAAARIEAQIEQAAITCYAIEGSYPPLGYLVDHYGLVLRPDKYYYHYEMIAPNILPTIMVIER